MFVAKLGIFRIQQELSNSNKGVIANKLEDLKWLDNEIMDLLTDEYEITNIMVANTEFEAKV